MKRYKRFLSLFFKSILVTMALIGCGKADADVTATAEENANVDDIVILYTNDVHTYVDGPIS